MAETIGGVPPNWYQYDFPLTNDGPTPSQARYKKANGATTDEISWLIEFFADILGYDKNDLIMWYENNSPNTRVDDIFLRHPNDQNYLPEASRCKDKSPEMVRYEQFAKGSSILKRFEENSPAKIEYFKPLCE